MKELVESGLGYTLLPLSAFSREAADGRFQHAPLERPRLTSQLVLATQPGNPVTRAARVLRTLVRCGIAALAAAGARQSVVSASSVSARGNHGGHMTIKKTTHHKSN